MAVLRFRMSGRTFVFDGDRDWTAAELWALDEIGVGHDELVTVLTRSSEVERGRALRVMCALAYVAALREDPDTKWAEFSRTIVPATFEALPDPAPVSGEVEKQAAVLAAKDEPSLVDLAAQVNALMAARAGGAAS